MGAGGLTLDCPITRKRMMGAKLLLIETRLALSSLLRKQRSDAALSQEGLAEKIHSSQSRIAKAEKGDPSITYDFLFRALLGAGTTNQQIGETIARTDAKI